MNSAVKTRRAKLSVVLPVALFVFLLAFAVFGWGLHSKLSLYKIDAQSSSQTPVAKLLSERERASVSATAEHLPVPPVTRRAGACACAMFVIPELLVSDAWRRELAPSKQQSVVRNGPALLRPPPALG